MHAPRSPDAPPRPPGAAETPAHPSAQPRPQECADPQPLEAQIEALTRTLAEKDRQQQDTDLRLETVRIQLEGERAERQRLERQLRALKSLEEHIKDRDAQTP